MKVDGKSYQVEVPDTLNLAERAALTIQPLLGFADSTTDLRSRIERGVCGPKCLEALPMMRTMTGNEEGLDDEQRIMESYLAQIEEDNLLYVPPYGPMEGKWGSILGQARLMLAWLAWYERDQDKRWLGYIERIARAMNRLAIRKDDYAYYPTETVFDATCCFGFRESGWKVTDEPQPIYLKRPGQILDMADREGHEVDARMGIHAYPSGPLRPLVRWHRLSGDTASLDLAKQLALYLSMPKLWGAFGEPAELGGAYRAHYSGHLHAHTMTLRGLLAYAEQAQDYALKRFCRDGYEYTRQFGIAQIGFIPEWTYNNLSEACQIADMVALAIRLSDAGLGDYWDDVDRYVRNHLIEQQYMTPGEKGYGAFAASSYPTHLIKGLDVPCCTGNASAALYYAWESIVRCVEGMSTVNLLLNRASEWLDIASHLPYEGKIVLKNKTAERIAVRIPDWADKNTVQVLGNQGKLRTHWVGNYAVFDGIAQREEITIEFPIVERIEKYIIPLVTPEGESFNTELSRLDWHGIWYTCHFKGNTLISIEPERIPPSLQTNDQVIPLYQRDYYRQDKAPLVRKTQFVPSRILNW